MSSNQDQDQPPLNILIVGCSIAGPALATFLLSPSSSSSRRRPPTVTILERAPSLRPHGQNVDVRGAGVTLVRKLGLETLVRAATTGEEGVQWVGPDHQVWASLAAGRSSPSVGDGNGNGSEKRKGGVAASTPTAEIEILRGRLAELLYKRCVGVSEDVVRAQGGRGGVEFLFGTTLDKIEQDGDGVTVHFATTTTTPTTTTTTPTAAGGGDVPPETPKPRRFDLVVGADGVQSATRKLIWGSGGDEEKTRLHKLGFYGAFFSMPRGPTDSAWRRWYHAPGRRGVMVRPDAQRGRTTVFLGVMSEGDGRLADVCGGGGGGREREKGEKEEKEKGGKGEKGEKEEKKGRARSREEEVRAQKELMREYFQDAGWESERVVQGMMGTEDFYYDVVAQVKMEHFSKGRVVLLGDAG